MKTSNFLSLNMQDALKALLMAILTPCLVIIQASVDAGTLTFDWKHIGMAAVGGGVAYLIKNFFTPTAVVSKIQAEADKK